ncbi:hypothetical protein PVAND_010379 [Polypedilum vanderplanki]|uniref:Uncharacterized protein n=1 Tax=Polypedilum vanderplanki TaxID=319348 RepID=A0A9J6CFQ8_POLVA|nr:hypothetical protein PVAND_010379 [Polypedilum vanderplanki]
MQRKRSWRIPKLFRQCVYVPPQNSATLNKSPSLPETVDDIQLELQKQENVLHQIHSEMHAGTVSKKREDELWETQRNITQLKRKLRTFEKKNINLIEKRAEDLSDENIDFTLQRPENDSGEQRKNNFAPVACDVVDKLENTDDTKICIMENGMYMLPDDHPDYETLIKLQLENQELLNFKRQLQERINYERAECVRLKKLLDNQNSLRIVNSPDEVMVPENSDIDSEYQEKLIEYFMKENSLLDQKRILLTKEIFNEKILLIQLQVDLAMKQFVN